MVLCKAIEVKVIFDGNVSFNAANVGDFTNGSAKDTIHKAIFEG